MRKQLELARITSADISRIFGIPVGMLFRICADSERMYLPPRFVKTPSGKIRELDVPTREFQKRLKALHRYIQREELFSPAAHGAICNRSSFTSAQPHVGKAAVAITDVSNCFPSISTDRLHRKLLELGFRSDTSKLLSGLMTCRNRIPQGAATSGDAINLFLWDVDNKVLEFCGDDVIYTRMVDDHVISGDDVDRVKEVAAFLEGLLRSNGLTINEDKKSQNGLMVAPCRQEVHSIGVNHPFCTRIPRPRHREYLEFGRKFIRACKAVSAESLPSVAAKRRQLMGYVNYSRQAQISPADQLARFLAQGDRIVSDRLRNEGITRAKKWWFLSGTNDRSIELSKRWSNKMKVAIAAKRTTEKSCEHTASSHVKP